MIRAAQPADVATLLSLIRELADYERLQHEVEASAGPLTEHLFGENPRCSALVATDEDDIVGYALYYPTYSTFKASPAMFLEDLYVTPAARGKGHGRALLAAVAAAAKDLGAARLDWNVLSWNQSAIDFYQTLGAEVLRDWRVCRLDRESLGRLAKGG